MITLWHNPRCSKSRQALALIEDAGADVTIRRYLDDIPSADEIKAALMALDLPVLDVMRTAEKTFKQAGLSKEMSEAELITAMATHPILIERPIALKEGRAVIGRPPEAVKALL